MVGFRASQALYVYGHLTISSSHIPVTALVWREKGTSPEWNAEEVPLVSHHHKDSQTTRTSDECARVCPHGVTIMEMFFFFP